MVGFWGTKNGEQNLWSYGGMNLDTDTLMENFKYYRTQYDYNLTHESSIKFI